MKRNVIFSLAMTAALLTSAFAAEVEFPERVDNAAIHYWAAVALLPRPENQEEIDAIKFIEDELPSLPPAGCVRISPVLPGYGTGICRCRLLSFGSPPWV